MKELLNDAAMRAATYLTGLATRYTAPRAEHLEALDALGGPLPAEPSEPASVIKLLDECGSPATVASAGPRYFGFVTGGTLPVALAANWLSGAWDQNAALYVMSPLAAALETIVIGWLQELFRLPNDCGVGFVTGATMANLTCLAAARHALLQRAGWDVEGRGLFGAPEINVIVGDEVHVSVLKALSLLGLGCSRVQTVPCDGQGRMRPESLPPLDDRTVVCIQAGNVNTGAFDPTTEICRRARSAGAWVHVDGSFGLWAMATPARAHLLNGFGEADSWATDCHKWLNVPYDSGLAFVREAGHLRSAMTVSAPYLANSGMREPSDYVPELSRRSRAIEIWAALRSLGKRGLAELIERNCRLAERLAFGLRRSGYSVLNDVVLNQVLVSFGEPETTRRVIAEVQREGLCWCGGTVWQGHTAMRISVSNWSTTEEDADRSMTGIVRIAESIRSAG